MALRCKCGRFLPKKVGLFKCPCGREYTISESPSVGRNIDKHMAKKRARMKKRENKKRR